MRPDVCTDAATSVVPSPLAVIACQPLVRTTFRIFGIIVLTCIAAALANASPITIFSSFGPGYAVDNNSYCVYGSSVASNCGVSTSALAPAAAFTSTGNYVVSQIDLSLNWYQGTNGVTVSIFTDVGNAPGVLLGSWTVSGLQDLPDPPLTTIAAGVTLASGASYFLQVAPGGATTEAGWVLGPSVGGVLYDPPSLGSGSIVLLPAFDVLGNAVPEPATAAVLTLGLVVILAARNSRKPQEARQGRPAGRVFGKG